MNLSKSPLRRAAGLAAGAVLGLAGIAVAATPAYATASNVGGSAVCDTTTGLWDVTWTVHGYAPDGVDSFQLKFVDSVVGLGEHKEKEGIVTGLHPKEDYPVNEPITGKQSVKGDAEYARLTIAAVFDNGHEDEVPHSDTVYFDGGCEKTESPSPSPSASSASPEPSDSTSSSPSTSPSPSPSETPELPDDLPGEPEPIAEITCDTMTLGFKNPANGITLNLHFKTSKGEERDLTIAPGESESATFSATDGFSVDLTISLTYQDETFSETVTIDYEQPEGCDNGEGGGLPVTGTAAGGIAAGAAGLLAVGGLLFFLARRRKVNFTA